jgi:ADP-ribose pyrophosphatase
MKVSKGKDILAYESKSLSVIHRYVEIDSVGYSYECVQRKEVAIIIPILNKGNVVMIQQYRPSIEQTIYEFPGGKIEASENLLAAASRELKEETGYAAGQIIHVKSFFSAPHFTNERINILIATQLTHEKSNLQEGEFIETSSVKIQDLSTMIKNNEVTDAKTIIGYYCLIDHITEK